MKKILLPIIIVSTSVCLIAQPFSRAFEFRCFTEDPSANGETDFKGETEWMDTEQRVVFLEEYAKFASVFFEPPCLDQEIVVDSEIDDLLSKIKPQPLTLIRKTIRLNRWKVYGYREGLENEKKENLLFWNSNERALVHNGFLKIDNTTINHRIDSLTWRFKIEAAIKNGRGGSCRINLLDGSKQAISFGIEEGLLVFGTENKIKRIQNPNINGFTKLTVEADLTQKRFNLYTNGKRIQYYIPMMDTSIEAITQLSISSIGIALLDDIFIIRSLVPSSVGSKNPFTLIIELTRSPIRKFTVPFSFKNFTNNLLLPGYLV